MASAEARNLASRILLGKRIPEPGADIQTTKGTDTPTPENLGIVGSGVEAFTGERRTTPDIAGLSEIGSLDTGDTGSNLQIAAGLLVSADPEQKIDIIRDAVPDAQIVTNENGITTVEVNGQKVVLNQPGFSAQDALNATAQVLAFFPAAKLVGLTKGVLAKVGVGAAAEGATSVGLDLAAEGLGSEQGVSGERAVIAATIGGVLPGAGGVTRNVIQKRAARRAATESAEAGLPQTREAVGQAQEASKATGVDLFPAQQTLIPSDLERQAFIATLPGGARVGRDALEAQNSQALGAVDDFIEAIAPESTLATAASRGKTAAQTAIERAKVARADKASPFYNDAFNAKTAVDASDVLRIVDDQLAQFPGSGTIGAVLKKTKRLISEAAEGVDGQGNLRKLHNAKIELDDMISTKSTGSRRLGPSAVRELTTAKNNLVEAMDQASPLYKQAREEFIAATPAVKELQESVIQRVADIPEDRLKRISAEIFDADDLSAATVNRAKAVIQSVDPQAWDQLVRLEMGRRLGAVRFTQTAVENTPGLYRRALFGNTKQRQVLLAALSPEQRANALLLDEALRRGSLGRAAGSPTATRQELKKELKGGFFRTVTRWATAPLKEANEAASTAGAERRARTMAEAIFNPQFSKEFARIRDQARKGGSDAAAAGTAFVQMLSRIEGGAEPTTE